VHSQPAVVSLLLPLVCRDGEDELYYNMLLEEEPEHKLQVTSVAA
jgi:hypothetical protein